MEHEVSFKQYKYDNQYLYGILQSSTKSLRNDIILKYKQARDGLSAWAMFEERYSHNGCAENTAEELEGKLSTAVYDEKQHKNIATFIDKLQTWAEELDGIPEYTGLPDSMKKRWLLRALRCTRNCSLPA